MTNDELLAAADVLWSILQPYVDARESGAATVTLQPQDFEALVGLYGLMATAARASGLSD